MHYTFRDIIYIFTIFSLKFIKQYMEIITQILRMYRQLQTSQPPQPVCCFGVKMGAMSRTIIPGIVSELWLPSRLTGSSLNLLHFNQKRQMEWSPLSSWLPALFVSLPQTCIQETWQLPSPFLSFSLGKEQADAGGRGKQSLPEHLPHSDLPLQAPSPTTIVLSIPRDLLWVQG